MERYTFDSDGLFNVVPDWNTSTTTVTIGSIPDGATVAVGVASTDGWSPLDGGQLVSGSTTTLTHGHDAQLQVLISGLVGSVSLDFRKEGVPSQHSLLEQIVQNTASPIRVDAPVDVPSLRQEGLWIEGVPRDEYEARLDRAKVDIVYGNANTEVTVTDENLTWAVAVMTTLQMPPPFTNYWSFDPTKAEFTYIGTQPQGYEISAGGLITSDSVTDTDHIQVRLTEPSGILTGSTKRYAAGRSLGQITSDVGFTSNGFGLFNPGDKVTLEVSKDFDGTLVLDDLLMAFRPIN